jgi:hypothetical protein
MQLTAAVVARPEVIARRERTIGIGINPILRSSRLH